MIELNEETPQLWTSDEWWEWGAGKPLRKEKAERAFRCKGWQFRGWQSGIPTFDGDVDMILVQGVAEEIEDPGPLPKPEVIEDPQEPEAKETPSPKKPRARRKH